MGQKRSARSLPPPSLSGYGLREENLRTLGFETYADYLRSELWAHIRSRVLVPGALCVGCRKKATQVHHASYRLCDLDGSDVRALHAVCGNCHKSAEFRPADGAKLGPEQATARLFGMRGRPRPPAPKPKRPRKPKRTAAEKAAKHAERGRRRLAAKSFRPENIRRGPGVEKW